MEGINNALQDLPAIVPACAEGGQVGASSKLVRQQLIGLGSVTQNLNQLLG